MIIEGNQYSQKLILKVKVSYIKGNARLFQNVSTVSVNSLTFHTKE